MHFIGARVSIKIKSRRVSMWKEIIGSFIGTLIALCVLGGGFAIALFMEGEKR